MIRLSEQFFQGFVSQSFHVLKLFPLDSKHKHTCFFFRRFYILIAYGVNRKCQELEKEKTILGDLFKESIFNEDY